MSLRINLHKVLELKRIFSLAAIDTFAGALRGEAGRRMDCIYDVQRAMDAVARQERVGKQLRAGACNHLELSILSLELPDASRGLITNLPIEPPPTPKPA